MSLRINMDACFRALAGRTRRTILARLVEQERNVSELTALFRGKIAQAAVSQHLKVLLDAKLVTRRKYGNFHFYRTNPASIEAVMRYFDSLWDDSLARLKTELER